jgi:hypothetical protein
VIAAILFIFYIILMFWSFGYMPLFRNSNLSARGLSLLFTLKLVFSIGLVLVYTYYYTDRGHADIYKYFDDGKVIYESINLHPEATFRVITGIGYDHSDPEIARVLANTHHFDKKGDGFIESNHHLIIRVNAILCFFSRSNIFINSIFLCFLSFMGSVALYRALEQLFEKGTGHILIIPVFLIPSILFWSSGLLQEALIIFFLGMLVFTSMKLAGMKNILVNLFLSVLFLQFLYEAKPFIALSFIISLYIMGTFHFRGYIRIISVLVATLLVTWFLYAHNTFICGIMSSIISKRNDFVALGLKMKAGSLIDGRILDSDCLTPLKLLPLGLYDMFFQPFVWSHGLFEKLFGAENLIVLLLSIFTLFNFKKPKGSKLQLAAFCFTFFMLNYLLIGITIPIIGALVRYKIFGLLFYLLFLACIVDLNKIISIISCSKYFDSFLQRSKKWLFK